MIYESIKIFHMCCAALSISGFFVRGIWMLQQSAYLQHCYVRRLPHVIDTLLLVSALLMVVMSQQYLLQQNWLTAKVLALVVYVLLGMVALRCGKTRIIRISAWVAAMLVFFYIVAVAVSRNPLVLF